ncbi:MULTISPECIES: LacI family DNA-binding transcriptional regulator [unclassified Streptomyces]|uniref:LacI family DNA-binding transcriptional regulator n=1 Tax=unclassified Streptomyces TaxID=2593676 RepID=UPI001F035AA0|nr:MULTISPECIES: LacI family DNA-binding transcriptional regulator [unclassified Streptomyces]MCH0565499.1 LacI family DNA-binding transcriptional regulator [Streptomyces sp. MUM 2J]MCH0569719.1 LacI family DNA-binding transcriptional regulator [Streptomyces sp. MUM 136J]
MAPGSTRPTSRDVARAAGVSQAAVSLVLGGKWRGRVSETTAQRVRDAARRLGYRPNLAARNLRLGRTRTVLLVVPALTTEFYGGVYTGAARVAAEHGFGVVLYPSPEGIGPARDPFASAQAALDGVIASSMAADALTALRGDQLPLVMLDSDPRGSLGAATVNLDITDGARQIADHLLGLGHRHFLHIAADIPSWTFEARARELAARVAAVDGTSLRTARTPMTIDGALVAAEAALAEAGPPATALVCDDDKLAAGAYKALRRRGLRIPDDVSVTGVDDISLAAALDPELTTVRLDAELFGERGMHALLAVLEGRTPESGDIPVELVVRGSTAPPKAS